jgi:hypothetical protein
LCVIQELDESIPAGWAVRYTVDDAEPTSAPEPFVVQGDTAVHVVITNDANGAVTSTTTTIAPIDPGPVSGSGGDNFASGASESGTLADTGAAAIGLRIIGLLSIGAGSMLTAKSRRTSRRPDGHLPTGP